VAFFNFFFVFLVCKCILVNIILFTIKICTRIVKKKYVFVFEKKYFDSLALKLLGAICEFIRAFCSLFTTI
jgi:hypothetical protein